MSPIPPQDEATLNARLDESCERLDLLAAERRTTDAEVEELAVEREQYGLLQDACCALEKLEQQDAAGLFWSGLTSDDAGRAQVRVARERLDAFQERLRQIEASRHALLEKIEREQEQGELLTDELDELRRAEEERKLEWIVEREPSPLPDRPSLMPWTRGGEDEARLRRALAVGLLLSLLLGVVFPWIPLPLPERWEMAELPERFTRLVREERSVPPPVQEQVRPRPTEQEPVEAEPILAEEATPEPVAKPEEEQPGAGSKGILAFREKFSALADSQAPARLGSQARIQSSGELASGRTTRSLVTTEGPGSSGGIDLAALSRDVAGGGGAGQAIEGVQVTQATSSIGTIGGGEDRPLSGGPNAARTDEEIQIVFDRHKAQLYRLYNRELRRDPTLQGQLVLRMTIEADGSVSLCELQSTDMKAPNLTTQVVERVKRFDFGAKQGIPAITILYPIDFLPAN